jgi:NADP-dependent 3-hydroxy acid dehydrogenase YdfG
LAVEFAGRGHRIIATARSEESIEDLSSDRITTARLDVTDVESIDSVVRQTGPFDIVVNNAGYALIGPVAELELDELRAQFETNVIGVVAVARAAVPQMVERRHGRIVNIGSVSGVTATPFGGAYCGTKAAVHLISDALRMELAPFGVHVISVQPGAIESRFGARARQGIERYREGSLYSKVFGSIEARAEASQVGSMPADEFARLVVSAVISVPPPPRIRAGTHSVRLPMIGWLPASVRDRIFSRKFGLHQLS